MEVTAKLLRVGKSPKPEFIGKKGILKVTFPVAEDITRKINGEWEKIGTSWFNVEAWGDTAESILADLKEGNAFELLKGQHQIDKVVNEGETNYYPKYKIFEYKKYD